MKERPILFSAPMVRAILDGTKTQTRRVVRFPRKRESFVVVEENPGDWWPYESDDGESNVCDDGCEHPYSSPFGYRGDRLWVRENHCFLDVAKSAFSQFPLGPENGGAVGPDVWDVVVEYSDGTEAETSVEGDKPKQTRARGETRWRPSTSMPRWASRITLEITAVRVERLQDISEQDAMAEGVDWRTCPRRQTEENMQAQIAADRIGMAVAYYEKIDSVGGYKRLWESINGPGSWDANPWVWVVEFKRVSA